MGQSAGPSAKSTRRKRAVGGALWPKGYPTAGYGDASLEETQKLKVLPRPRANLLVSVGLRKVCVQVTI